jgi:Tannase-like family of unknown function (DUF6351)
MRPLLRYISIPFLTIGLLAAGAIGDAAPPGGNHLVITPLSTGADRVSGGDVLVRIDVPGSAGLADVQVTLNGNDVTGTFVPDPTSHALVGLVTGLVNGDNVLTASSRRTKPSLTTRLDLRNFPIYGPIFAGPHQTPWICETVASGLGPSSDEHCTVPVRYDWFYRAQNNTFKPLPSLTPPFPADLAQTTTIDGRTVNYIVRVESGTIDQSIYRIAIIDDPTQPISNPWSAGGKKPGPGWNGKLSFPFGGGCGPAYRSGRNVVTSALSNDPLSLGFAVAFGTRNTLGNGCDFVVSAETMMMIKEHFIEQYGVPKFTIGSGGSGGSMQQHFIAQNYPGLLDAITPGISYPDLVTILPDVTDCGLLNHYFNANLAQWPAVRRPPITGYPVSTTGATAGIETCTSWDGFAHTWVSPFNGFDPVVPVADRYDPVTNPTGARGTFTDGMKNVFGIDPHTGFAPTVYDNVGVQYGFKALNNGNITVDEFLDLNAKIGGLDVDGNYMAARSAANLKGVEIAYRDGVVDSGQNLTLPIIDTRNYLDDLANIHTRIRTFAKLARLQRTNGTIANEVNWLTANVGTIPNLARMALIAHNQWLENILADTSDTPSADKVIRNKPASLKDTCWDSTGAAHEETFTLTGPSVCNTLFPINSTVRIQAGGPVAGDILVCHLKRIDFRDYAVAFTEAQRARLQAIFPQGVCDWSRPGVKERGIEGVWLDYTPPDDRDDR